MKLKKTFIVIGSKRIIFTILFYSFIFGLRPDSLGSDTLSYKFFFENYMELPFEKGFNLMIILLRPLGWFFFKLFYSFLFVSITSYNLVRLGVSNRFIFMLFATALFVQFGINTIRASSSLILLIYLIRVQSFTIHNIFWTLVASLFHSSAFLVAPLVVLFRSTNRVGGAFLAGIGVLSILKFHDFSGVGHLVLNLGIFDQESFLLLSKYAEKTYETGFRPEFLFLPWFYILLTSRNIFTNHVLIGLALLPVMLFPMMDRIFIFYWVFCVLMFLKFANYDWRIKLICLTPIFPGLLL
jgi:hypothetical protein